MAEEWAQKKTRRFNGRDLHVTLTPSALLAFADNARSLLEKKFRGEPIAQRVLELSVPSDPAYSDSGQYLKITESLKVFWAWQYSLLFEELEAPPDDRGWLDMVATCEECDTFYVKQRHDQRFDTDRCRINFHGRKAAVQRVQPKRRRNR